MNTNHIANIASIATRFASACNIVKNAIADGYVDASRGAANDKQVKVTTAVIADTSKLTPEALQTLKKALRLYNAGHAMQTAFSCNIALVGELASEMSKIQAAADAEAKAKAETEAPGVLVEMPATEQPTPQVETPATVKVKGKKSA